MSIPKRPLEGPCHINRTAPALHGFGPSGRSSNILLHYFNEQFTNCQEILTAGQKKYIIRAQSYPAKCRSGHGRAKARIRESRRPVSGRAASGFARIAMPTTAERGGEPPPGRARYSPNEWRFLAQFGWNRGAGCFIPYVLQRGGAFFRLQEVLRT